jgi:hypothetical protein
MSLCNKKIFIPVREWAQRKRLEAAKKIEDEKRGSSSIVDQLPGNVAVKVKTPEIVLTELNEIPQQEEKSIDQGGNRPDTQDDEEESKSPMDVDTDDDKDDSDEIDASGNLKGFVVPDNAPLEYDSDASMATPYRQISRNDDEELFGNIRLPNSCVSDNEEAFSEYDSDSEWSMATETTQREDQADAHGNLKGFVVPDDAPLEYDTDVSENGPNDANNIPKTNTRIRRPNILKKAHSRMPQRARATSSKSAGADGSVRGPPKGDSPVGPQTNQNNAEPNPDENANRSFARFKVVMQEYFSFMTSSKPGVSGSLEVKPDGAVSVTIWNSECGCDTTNQSTEKGPARKPVAVARSSSSTSTSEDDTPLTQLRSKKRSTKRMREDDGEMEDRGVENRKRVRRA